VVPKKEGDTLEMDGIIEFNFTSPLVVEETTRDFVMVEATLLNEGVSKNGHLYTVQETDFVNVAKTAVGKPIYFGTNVFGEHAAPPIRGTFLQRHSGTFSEVKPIGKIVKAWFESHGRKVKAKLKIWEPSLINRIREGFKVSVRGIFNKFRQVLFGGRKAIQIIGLKIRDIQLLNPSTTAGVSGAKVDKVLEESLVEGTMSFNFESGLTDMEEAQLIQELYNKGLI